MRISAYSSTLFDSKIACIIILMCLIPLFTGLVLAQDFSIGIKGGAKLTNDPNEHKGDVTWFPESKAYTVGPVLEITFSSISVEIDTLYKRFGARYFERGIHTPLFSNYTRRDRLNSWEFPILLKYSFPNLSNFYISGGYAFNRMSGSKNIEFMALYGDPYQRTDSIGYSNSGFLIGSGIEFKAGLLKVSPELRYTRWLNDLDESWVAPPINKNRIEILIGIMWDLSKRRS